MSDFKYLNIEKDQSIAESLTFLTRFQAAAQSYVSARVMLDASLVDPGVMLAHHSIEVLVKAIVRLKWDELERALNVKARGRGAGQSVLSYMERKWSHDVLKVMNDTKDHIAIFKELLSDDEVHYALPKLKLYYLDGKYGELKTIINGVQLLKFLDRVWKLLYTSYQEMIRSGKGALFVPTLWQEAFLRNNDAFTHDEITDDPFAIVAMPGMGSILDGLRPKR